MCHKGKKKRKARKVKRFINPRIILKVYREDARHNQNSRCCYCREPLRARTTTAEHKMPKSLGGKDTRDNIAASCHDCNNVKGHLTDAKFRAMIKAHPENMKTDFRFWRIWSKRKINLLIERIEKRWT